jgi:galactofuranosylgalactofuranosylrhamnosyl-N-acetylglucosaminyl-diphospho-decaprenol beta-1,5/1,6-galactofuranosyltransferase
MSSSVHADARSNNLAAVRRTMVDHDAPTRLVVQRGTFAGPSPRVSDDLYASITVGDVHRRRFDVTVEQGASVDTDTYFGRFAASYFQRWTTVTEVAVSFDFEGAGEIRLRASDSGGNDRTVTTVRVSGSGRQTLSSPVNSFLDGGYLWIEIAAVEDRVRVSAVEWTVAAPAVVRPAAVAICTFNRADDCAETLAALAADEQLVAGLDAVFVVDQGTDVVADRPLFAEVRAILGDKLVYIQQPNLGGAGGFTRGMFEITAINEHANVILMDDDILCEPESILRMNAFANVTVTPTLVGAQMLYLMNPLNLHVSGEEADLPKLKAGRWSAHSLHDADLTEKRQNKRVDAGYNAWWSCLIPAEVISEIGLPLPMFFQWDDIEFGIRARAHGFATATLPNAGVWHADFHWKDRDDWAKYFSARNSLIAAALHSDFDVKSLSKQLTREISQFAVSMQYGLALTTLQAIEDFLVGPPILEDGGQSVLASVRAMRSAHPETVKHPASAVPGVVSSELVTRPAGFTPNKKMLDLVLLKRVRDQFRGRVRGEFAYIPAAEAHWWHVSLFDRAVVADASQSGVRVRRRDVAEAKVVAARLKDVMRRFRTEGPEVQRQFRAALPALTSRETWARLYDIDDPAAESVR